MVRKLLTGYDALVEAQYFADSLIHNYNTACQYVYGLAANPISDKNNLLRVMSIANNGTELQSNVKFAIKAAIRKGILNRIDLQ